MTSAAPTRCTWRAKGYIGVAHTFINKLLCQRTLTMLWWLCFAAMSLSCAALVGSLLCWFHVRKLLRGASVRSLAALSIEVAELSSVSESQEARLRRLTSRAGMAELRERRAAKADASSTRVGDRVMTKDELREVARARGFKVQ